jgi:D-3-phosphoglycerate dehydrogenase
MSAFGTRLIAYDPYVAPARAAQIGVRLVSLEQLLRESDFISIHLPKTPETVGLIGAEQLAMCKPTVRIVNAARGGLLDEAALADALSAGTVAGAGLDVYATEPCTDSPLFGFDSVVVAPHLGASTVEAQDKAGIAVARSVRLALEGDFVPDAVNVQAGGIVAEELRPALPLVEKLGRVFTALAGGLAASMEVQVRGGGRRARRQRAAARRPQGRVRRSRRGAGHLRQRPVAGRRAGPRGRVDDRPGQPDYRNVVRVHGVLPTGELVSVSGTLTGPRQVEKLVEVDGFDIELVAEKHVLLFRYHDRPAWWASSAPASATPA